MQKHLERAKHYLPKDLRVWGLAVTTEARQFSMTVCSGSSSLSNLPKAMDLVGKEGVGFQTFVGIL